MTPPVRKEQKLCLKLLQRKERKGEEVTRKEIADYTGWKEKGTVHTYLSKGNLEKYVTLVDKKAHVYKVHNTIGVSPLEFAACITQKHAPIQIIIADKAAIKKEKKVSDKLLEKSIHAALSAIEIYNKPDFKYREETFSILMVNAWEMLLKAKCVKDGNEDISCIQEGNKAKTNISRCGNIKTIDIFKAARKLKIENDLISCLNVLVEIRDNAVHFFNENKLLNKKVLEVGTASLKSYIQMVKDWFNKDMSQYNFYLMPMSFFHLHEMESHSVSSDDEQHNKLLGYIAREEKANPSHPAKKHNISLIIEAKWAKSTSLDAKPYINDPTNPNAVSMKVDSEDAFRNKYPWNWTDDLKPKILIRYNDLRMTNEFWQSKRELEKNPEYCGERFLDWHNPKGTMKKFYSTNILKGFDKLYTKRGSAKNVKVK